MTGVQTCALPICGIEAPGLPMTLAKMAFCGFAAIIALLLTPQPLDELTEDHDGEPAAG